MIFWPVILALVVLTAIAHLLRRANHAPVAERAPHSKSFAEPELYAIATAEATETGWDEWESAVAEMERAPSPVRRDPVLREAQAARLMAEA